MQVVLDRFGRIVIPKRLRRRLGMEPGSALTIEESGKKLTLTPARQGDSTEFEGAVLVFMGEIDGDLAGALEKTREERLSVCLPDAGRT